MSVIQISIEGAAAPAAAAALVQLSGVSGTYEQTTTKETTIAAIATIVGIVGGAVALAEQLRKWYQEWQTAQSDKEFHVVIFDPDTGNRVLLKNATIEEITDILKTLK